MLRKSERNRIELLGTLDMLIRAGSNEVLQVETGSLYPALHCLEKRRWIQSEWKTSENKQRAKYYRLTASGKKQLAAEQSRWTQLVEAMAALMQSRGSEVRG